MQIAKHYLFGAGGILLGAAAKRFVTRSARRTDELELETRQHVAVVVQTNPSQMPWTGLDFATSFYFPADFRPTDPPDTALTDWWSWAHQAGGRDVRVTKVLVTLQGVGEEAAVVVGEPRIRHECTKLSPGVVCFPEGLGGGGVQPRRYEVTLRASGAPAIRYMDRAERPPSFSLRRGETEQIEIIVGAGDPGLHEWWCGLPLIINGEPSELLIDDAGTPFVTIGVTDDCSKMMWVDGHWV